MHKDRPSDKTRKCPECGKSMKARGIGGHLHKVHGIVGCNVKQSVKQGVGNVKQSVKQVVKWGDEQYAKRCGISIERLRYLRYLESVRACFMCERQKLKLIGGVCYECGCRERR